MLKKMRWRMIVSAMAAFFAVMLLLISLIFVGNYTVSTRRSDNTLEEILRYEQNMNASKMLPAAPDPVFPERPDREMDYMTRFFSVRLGSDGSVSSLLMDHIATIDETEAQDLAAVALESGKTSGYLGSYRYAVRGQDGDTVIAFLNVTREQENMRTLLLLSLLVAAGSLAVVFMLVFLLSKRAVRPFAENIERQKRFITDAGHELKTPLTSISTSLDVMTLEHGEDEWTANIRKQTTRLTKLVGELVTLSRLDEMDPVLSREVFSLSEVAWEAAEAFGTIAEAQGKLFSADIADNITIKGDRTSMLQMFSVLLDNAVKYSPEGGEIRFCLKEKGGKILAEVFNTCCYVVPPDTDRLFDRFYRPDDSRNVNTGGTGVGLAIAKAAVEAHGGKISASCPDGSTMTITAVL